MSSLSHGYTDSPTLDDIREHFAGRDFGRDVAVILTINLGGHDGPRDAGLALDVIAGRGTGSAAITPWMGLDEISDALDDAITEARLWGGPARESASVLAGVLNVFNPDAG